jgi:hypothetical protein
LDKHRAGLLRLRRLLGGFGFQRETPYAAGKIPIMMPSVNAIPTREMMTQNT